MYRSHNLIWLLIPFLVCVVLLVRYSFWTRGHAHRAVVVGLWVSAALLIVLMLALRSYDRWKLRSELAGVAVHAVTNVALSRNGDPVIRLSPSETLELLALLKSVSAVPAHHSRPIGAVEVSFEYLGSEYRYKLSQDSERPYEYWVIPMNHSTPGLQALEMGRIQSADLTVLLDRLLKRSDVDLP